MNRLVLEGGAASTQSSHLCLTATQTPWASPHVAFGLPAVSSLTASARDFQVSHWALRARTIHGEAARPSADEGRAPLPPPHPDLQQLCAAVTTPAPR